MIDKVDPMITLFLLKMQELRVNQVLVLYPRLVKLPYENAERLHQYWLGCGAGFTLCMIDEHLR